LGSWRSSVFLATAGATLLVNGGAELGSLAGWQLAPAGALGLLGAPLALLRLRRRR
jgi:hypothetical protein